MTVSINTAPISPLRQRMQHDMMMRGLGPHTQQDYIRHVKRLAAFLGRLPDTAAEEDLRRFQIHQHENGARPSTINGAVSALRFLFTVTLKRRDLSRALVVTRNVPRLPEVLSVEEAARLLQAVPGIKYKAALGVAYGAGLRVLAAAETMLTIAADPRHLGARIGITAVLHSWGSAMTHHPHILLHVLPRGFHRIRHYGLLASASRRDNLALARRLLAVPSEPEVPTPENPLDTCSPCPCCGGRMIVIEAFVRWCQPRAPPTVLLPVRELAS